MITRIFVVTARMVTPIVVCTWLCGAGILHAQSPRRVFVTSETGTADLSTWPDSGGLGGLAGADAVCQARALAAGLGNASGFVAWMSDSSNDAYCRIHGLSGLKAANCGLPTLPVAAGPWVRIDDFPFSGTIDRLLEPAQEVLAPVWLDEFGNHAPDVYFTATGPDGELSDDTQVTCADWTATPAEMVVAGDPRRTSQSWTFMGTASCTQQRRLLCMEMGLSTSLPPYQSGGAVAFVTSADGTGDLSSWPEAGGAAGIAAGDAICRTLAASAGLDEPASFKAWLSDGTSDAVNRITYNGPWIRLDGVKIVDNKPDLTNGDLWTSISIDENGVYWHNHRGWTGTTSSGLESGYDCDDWTNGSDAFEGTEAYINAADDRWTDSFHGDCDNWWYHIYCFSEVPTFIFMDEFESGDTAGWPVIIPDP